MKSSARNIQMTSFDDLFSAGNPAGTGGETVQEIALTDLFSFKDHPFKVLDDETMRDTVESIKAHGVLVPGIARPRAEGGYELVAGHRRKHASELAGKTTMPVIIRELDDDESILLMVDSNIQRENLFPSEKAWAYCAGCREKRTDRGRGQSGVSGTAAGENAGKRERKTVPAGRAEGGESAGCCLPTPCAG